MKITILAVALVSAMAMTACNRDEPVADTTVTDTAATETAVAEEGAMDGAPATDMGGTENPMVGGAPMFADKDI
ncbi:MAG: hypothetical protein M3Q13_07030, partial [Pseudomonadota bacterium]|nr:hypothetical protein [Pseudomonadota bacterium]